MQTLKNQSFKDKRVLVRVDFNVPLNDSQEITDISRISAAIPTIKKIILNGGTPVIISHLGRPKGKDSSLSLFPVAKLSITIISCFFGSQCSIRLEPKHPAPPVIKIFI